MSVAKMKHHPLPYVLEEDPSNTSCASAGRPLQKAATAGGMIRSLKAVAATVASAIMASRHHRPRKTISFVQGQRDTNFGQNL